LDLIILLQNFISEEKTMSTMKTETLNSCNVCSSENILTIDDKICLCQCNECGYTFDSPRPTSEAIAEFYSKPTQYDDWISELANRDGLWLRRIEKLKATKKEGTVLDIGAGIGQFLHHAKPLYQNVFGTEVSSSAISNAKAKYGIDLIQGSIEKIDFGNQKFDNITMFHVLEHVHDPKSVVQKCCDLLTQDGIYVVSVPNDTRAWRSNLVLLKILKNWIKGFKSHGLSVKLPRYGKWGLPKIVLDGSTQEIHLSHFTPEVLTLLLKSSGFSVIETSIDPYQVNNGFINRTWYAFHKWMHEKTGRNNYETIWIVAKKQ
jgi:2-polyprenyl-3-methyl-5-hydroxy-6-metoxy-1,4-benzoquinol methylase